MQPHNYYIEYFFTKAYEITINFLKKFGIYLAVTSLVFYTQINWAKSSHNDFDDIELRLFLGFIAGIILSYVIISAVKKFRNSELVETISLAISPGIFFIFLSKYKFVLFIIPILCILILLRLYLKEKFFLYLSKFLGITSFFLLFIGSIGIIYAAFCAFTAGKFVLIDYGKYTNMIWNSGHGHLFRELMNYSYLGTHLSFTLILLGPFFYIWDHPFLLSFLQWLFAMIGIGIVGWIAIKNRVNWIITCSFLFFATVNPITQQVLLSEFHGTGLYFLLFPLLYYFLLYNKKLIIIPLLLLYGVREDSAFLVIPILLYFAITERWKWGYFWSFLSLFYGIFACFFLFKWINGIPLHKRRPGIKLHTIERKLTKIHYLHRLKAFFWIYLPSMPFLKKAWIPILVFPSAGAIISFFSPYPVQAALLHHYPTPIIITMIIAILHGLVRYNNLKYFTNYKKVFLYSLFLVMVTLISHHFKGFLPGGRFNSKFYTNINMKGLATLDAIKHIPKKGILLCSARLAGFCANRADLMVWHQYKKYKPKIIFFQIPEARGRKKKILKRLIMKGKFGVKFFNGNDVILIKDYKTDKNKRVLQAIIELPRTIIFGFTHFEGGKNIKIGDYIVRYWDGKGAYKKVVYHSGIILKKPGRYKARFIYKIMPPKDKKKKSLKKGWFGLYMIPTGTEIKKVEIECPKSKYKNGFQEQVLEFNIKTKHPFIIEPRVIGGDYQLWLDRVIFELSKK